MKASEKIRQLVVDGRSDKYICKKLGLDTRELGAYKAHISRGLQKILYPNEDHFTLISAPQAHRLPLPMQIELADIVTNLQKGSNMTANRQGVGALVKGGIRNIIIELKDSGVSHEDVYKDPRLSDVPQGTIRAHLAHYGRGSYK